MSSTGARVCRAPTASSCSRTTPATSCNELRVPRGRQPDGLWEDGRVAGAIAAGRLLVHHDGNAEPRPLHGESLHRVHQGRALRWMQSGRRTDARHMADAIGKASRGAIFGETLGRHEIGDPHPTQLRHLLLERHPVEEITDAIVDGGGGVTEALGHRHSIHHRYRRRGYVPRLASARADSSGHRLARGREPRFRAGRHPHDRAGGGSRRQRCADCVRSQPGAHRERHVAAGCSHLRCRRVHAVEPLLSPTRDRDERRADRRSWRRSVRSAGSV